MADGGRIEFFELSQVLGIYEERGNSIAELTPAVADALVTEVLEVFRTEGYGTWPRFWWERQGKPKPGSMKPKRGRRRAKASTYRRWRGTPKLLQDTGNLVGSITPDHHGATAEAYTNVPYAKFHASRRPRSKIPLRDFFAIDEQKVARDVEDMVLRYIDRPLAAE